MMNEKIGNIWNKEMGKRQARWEGGMNE